MPLISAGFWIPSPALAGTIIISTRYTTEGRITAMTVIFPPHSGRPRPYQRSGVLVLRAGRYCANRSTIRGAELRSASPLPPR